MEADLVRTRRVSQKTYSPGAERFDFPHTVQPCTFLKTMQRDSGNRAPSHVFRIETKKEISVQSQTIVAMSNRRTIGRRRIELAELGR